METIKVNMNPNPLDVQTIHASQNDGEARQWEFELHNNGELIDTSKITEQMLFKAYKGGTEQILPENTSTPTTSPFLGDIKYPQGLLTDQEFTYRQSPTEEDGLANITDIKGNTIVWNQLLNVEPYTTNTSNGVTFTKNADNTLSITGTATGRVSSGNFARPNIVNGHKYLIYLSKAISSIYLRSTVGIVASVQNSSIFTSSADGLGYFYFDTNESSTQTFNITNLGIGLFDLTLMFGAGNEPTTVDEFTSLFPLSYYSYNQGSLLSFNGNGIKTVGKNFFNGFIENTRTSAGYYIKESLSSNLPTPIKLPKGTYTFSVKSNVSGTAQLELFSGGTANADRVYSSYVSIVEGTKTYTFTVEKDIDYIRLYGNFAGTLSDVQIEFGSSATEYEPYTSSTLSLPISTYFPTGMKSAGNVYDELTESKAITRMGSIIFDGTQIPVKNTVTSTQCRAFYNVSDVLPVTRDIQVIEQDLISNYLPCESNYHTNVGAEGIHRRISGQTEICVSLGINRGITTWDEFKAYLSAHPLTVYYPLASPIETTFTTTSLVTENAEIPLSNNDGVLIGRCTEQLSENPGFIDAKIKLSDSDGECYSNKIQLHIERSPQ